MQPINRCIRQSRCSSRLFIHCCLCFISFCLAKSLSINMVNTQRMKMFSFFVVLWKRTRLCTTKLQYAFDRKSISLFSPVSNTWYVSIEIALFSNIKYVMPNHHVIMLCRIKVVLRNKNPLLINSHTKNTQPKQKCANSCLTKSYKIRHCWIYSSSVCLAMLRFTVEKSCNRRAIAWILCVCAQNASNGNLGSNKTNQS